MAIINIEDYFFPVFGVHSHKEIFVINQLYGTASYIGNGFFVTAGHTITNANSEEKFGIGYVNDNRQEWNFLPVSDFEVFEELDIGIFKCEKIIDRFKVLKVANGIRIRDLALLDDVYTCGYPHAYEKHNATLRKRALKGYIVSIGKFFERKRPIDFFELSFNCPKGISGAPLLVKNEKKSPLIIGYIIGHNKTNLLVNIDIEVSDDGNKKTVYETTESTYFGVAVSNKEFVNCNSRLLQMKVLDYLVMNNIIEEIF
jgi:hypothetical protein